MERQKGRPNKDVVMFAKEFWVRDTLRSHASQSNKDKFAHWNISRVLSFTLCFLKDLREHLTWNYVVDVWRLLEQPCTWRVWVLSTKESITESITPSVDVAERLCPIHSWRLPKSSTPRRSIAHPFSFQIVWSSTTAQCQCILNHVIQTKEARLLVL